jgi:hypothetical protein
LGTKKLEFETFRAETVIMAKGPLVIKRRACTRASARMALNEAP